MPLFKLTKSSGRTFRGKTGGGLYAFTTFTFTNAGITGSAGPSLANCLSSYSTASYPWLNDTSFFNVTLSGFQQWKCPQTGLYRLRAAGAASAGANSNSSAGIIVECTTTLTQGTVYTIAVGQMGIKPSISSSGGGGTFMVQGANPPGGTPIIIAGGGGGVHNLIVSGSGNALSGTSGGTSTCNTGTGGTSGNGGYGSSNGWGGGGGGFISNGTNAAYCNDTFGRGWNSNLQGGGTCNNTTGGFGGGGGTHGNSGGGGGGGGYSGGGGSNQDSSYVAAGGGGSYGITTLSTIGYNTSHGYLTIEKL